MSSSNQKSLRANVQALLEEAQIAVCETHDTQGGQLHELESSQCGWRTLVFDGKDKGISLALRLEIPPDSPLSKETATSTETLAFLGALTLALQGHQAEARLISGSQSLEAVLISRHLCERELDPASVNGRLEKLRAIARQVEPALSASGRNLVDRILTQVRPIATFLTKEGPPTEPVIVPTFDEEARNRMMQRAKG